MDELDSGMLTSLSKTASYLDPSDSNNTIAEELKKYNDHLS